VLLEEIAGFLVYRIRDFEAGLKVAMTALSINPIATGLWNVFGDALFYLRRHEEAAGAFGRAIEINPNEIRARLNLAWTLADMGRISDSLRIIAEALALDRRGEYRDALLGKQRDALEQLSAMHHEEQVRHVNRFRRHRGVPR
jgi:tetratricopeptide (TPR) repeat protein